MVSVAIGLPGYQDYCSHQHEIHDRCEEWANCIENKSKYFPCGVGSTPKDSKTEGNAWNLLNAEFACDRIRYAVEALNNQSSLKSSITDRYLNSPDSFARLVARKATQGLKYSHTTKETVPWIAYRIF